MLAAIVQGQDELSAGARVIAAGLPAKGVFIRIRIVGKTSSPGQGKYRLRKRSGTVATANPLGLGRILRQDIQAKISVQAEGKVDF